MSSTAIGETASFLNAKILECIGKIEYFERAKAAGFPGLPAWLSDYETVKLRDLSILRDSLTQVFYYQRLTKEEIEELQKKAAEAVEKAKADAAEKATGVK
jgi:hypothetical protein